MGGALRKMGEGLIVAYVGEWVQESISRSLDPSNRRSLWWRSLGDICWSRAEMWELRSYPRLHPHTVHSESLDQSTVEKERGGERVDTERRQKEEMSRRKMISLNEKRRDRQRDPRDYSCPLCCSVASDQKDERNQSLGSREKRFGSWVDVPTSDKETANRSLGPWLVPLEKMIEYHLIEVNHLWRNRLGRKRRHLW
jgi:hypothetical protein